MKHSTMRRSNEKNILVNVDCDLRSWEGKNHYTMSVYTADAESDGFVSINNNIN